MGSHSPRAVLRIVTELDTEGNVVNSYSEPIRFSLRVNGDDTPPATRKDREAGRTRAARPPVEHRDQPATTEESRHQGANSARGYFGPAELEQLDQLVGTLNIDKVHEDLHGLSADELLKVDGFTGAVQALALNGVANAVSLTLWRGPTRVMKVLRYADKQCRKGGVRSRAGLIAELLRKEPPGSPSSSGEGPSGPVPVGA